MISYVIIYKTVTLFSMYSSHCRPRLVTIRGVPSSTGKMSILNFCGAAVTTWNKGYYCTCGSVVGHCVSSAKGCGFNSKGTHTDKKCISCMHFKSLWLKASAKCIHVNVNVFDMYTHPPGWYKPCFIYFHSSNCLSLINNAHFNIHSIQEQTYLNSNVK